MTSRWVVTIFCMSSLDCQGGAKKYYPTFGNQTFLHTKSLDTEPSGSNQSLWASAQVFYDFIELLSASMFTKPPVIIYLHLISHAMQHPTYRLLHTVKCMPYHGSQPLSDKDGKVAGRHSDPAGCHQRVHLATMFSGFPLLPFMLTSSCDVDTGSPGPPQDAHTHTICKYSQS